jgi:hypothetical protein
MENEHPGKGGSTGTTVDGYSKDRGRFLICTADDGLDCLKIGGLECGSGASDGG